VRLNPRARLSRFLMSGDCTIDIVVALRNKKIHLPHARSVAHVYPEGIFSKCFRTIFRRIDLLCAATSLADLPSRCVSARYGVFSKDQRLYTKLTL
jgi:hypothetical protein